MDDFLDAMASHSIARLKEATERTKEDEETILRWQEMKNASNDNIRSILYTDAY